MWRHTAEPARALAFASLVPPRPQFNTKGYSHAPGSLEVVGDLEKYEQEQQARARAAGGGADGVGGGGAGGKRCASRAVAAVHCMHTSIQEPAVWGSVCAPGMCSSSPMPCSHASPGSP